MRITNFMVDYPCRVICCSYFVLILFGAIAIALGYMSPTLGGGRGRDNLIWMNPITVDYDKLQLVTEYMTETRGDASVDVQTEVANGVFILYSNLGDHPNGLLDVNALKIMKKMEDAI